MTMGKAILIILLMYYAVFLSRQNFIAISLKQIL